MATHAPKRFKTARLWLVIGLGVIPFTGLPLAVQVGLAAGDVVLLMVLSAMARTPGTQVDSPPGTPDDDTTGALAFGILAQAGADHGMGPHAHSHDHGGGDSGQAADGWGGNGGGGDSDGPDRGGGGGD